MNDDEKWRSLFAPLVAKRNRLETIVFEAIVEAHSMLQTEAAELRTRCRRLTQENEALRKDNELLQHDSGSNGKASAPRVRSLESQLAAMQTDLNEFRQSQQRVVRRYDDDLSDTKKLLEKSEMKIKKLENEAALLQDQLRSAHHDLTDTKECLQKTHEELEETERVRDQLAREHKETVLSMVHVKLKGVRKAIEDLGEEFSGPHSDPSKMIERFAYLRQVIEDASHSAGPETHEEIRRSLQQAATALRLPFADWLNGMTEELLLYKRILVEKETWGASPLSSSQGSSGSRESSSKVWSEHIELLMARLEDSFEFLKQSFIPCSWAWVTLASTVDRIVEDVVAETATLPAQSSNLPSVTRRINTLAFLDDRYPALIDSIVAAFTARHEFIRDGSVGELLEVFAETRSSIFPRAQQLIPTASSLAFTASSSVLNALYSIDMNHYKKYKHKDAFTQTNKHLKQATDHTMKTYLSQLETAFACSNTRLTPLGGIPSKVFLAVLKNFVEVLQAVLLGESANRWYYAEQSAAFESDIQAAKRFFTSKGIGPETVSTVFAKLSALVSTVMSQPTEQLINGGGICLPFNDLPEEAKGSVWCKQVVRQVLARRKDKKAKAFVAKQAKHSHKR